MSDNFDMSVLRGTPKTKSYINHRDRENTKPIPNEVFDEVKDLIKALMDKSKKTGDPKIIQFARTIVLELGFSFALTGSTPYVDIKQIYEIANDFFPDDLEIQLYLGRVYIHMEENEKAEIIYSEILNKFPNHPIATKALRKLDLEKLKKLKITQLDLSLEDPIEKPIEEQLEKLKVTPQEKPIEKQQVKIKKKTAEIPTKAEETILVPTIETAVKTPKQNEEKEEFIKILSNKTNFRTIGLLKKFVKDQTNKDITMKKRADIELESAEIFIESNISLKKLKTLLKPDLKEKTKSKTLVKTKTPKKVQTTLKVVKKTTPKKKIIEKTAKEQIFTPRKEIDWLIMTNQEIKDTMAKFKTLKELKAAAAPILTENDLKKRSRKTLEQTITRRIKGH